MKKFLKVLVMVVVVTLFATGCTSTFTKENKKTNEYIIKRNDNSFSKYMKKKNYGVDLNFSDIISELDEEPVWSYNTFPTINDFIL